MQEQSPPPSSDEGDAIDLRPGAGGDSSEEEQTDSEEEREVRKGTLHLHSPLSVSTGDSNARGIMSRGRPTALQSDEREQGSYEGSSSVVVAGACGCRATGKSHLQSGLRENEAGGTALQWLGARLSAMLATR